MPAVRQRYGNATDAPAFGAALEGGAGGNASAGVGVNLAAYPSLQPFRYVGCRWAWTCLAVGSVEEACRACEEESDLVAYAAALTLSGNSNRALLILEAYIVGVSVACYEALSKKAGATKKKDLARRHNHVVAEWLQTRTGPNPHLKDAEYRYVMRYVVALVEWRAVLRWYSIALVLRNEDDEAEVYEAPKNVWFRYFFALFPDGVPRQAPNGVSRGGNIPQLLEDLESAETLRLLLAQCRGPDVQVVSAITAFVTQHFRSCLVYTSRALQLMGSEAAKSSRTDVGPAEGLPLLSSSSSSWTLSGAQLLDTTSMRFLRCRAALEVGERTQAAADIIALMQLRLMTTESPSQSRGKGGASLPVAGHAARRGRRDSPRATVGELDAVYLSAVGSALALYGLPLAEAREAVLATLCDTRFSALARRYVLTLCGYVHALTLLQVGEPDAAAEVSLQVAPYGANSLMAESLYDVIVRCAVGLEDSTLALETPLSPFRLLYLALSPAFFGGLCSDGIRLKRRTDTFELLYPSGFSSYMPARQMLPFHMNRAFYFFSHGNYKDAWDDVCCAVATADELVGSTEFAFTECFPLRVYFFGCQVALVLLELLFQEEVDVVKACLRVDEELDLREKGATQDEGFLRSPQDTDASSATAMQGASLSGAHPSEQLDITDALLKGKGHTYNDNDELAREVITLCRQWARQIQRYYPHSVLGDVAQVRVAVMTREVDMLKQAVVLSRRYPSSTLAQNTLTLALYFSHNISEAVDIAQKNFQDFPHARDVVEIHRFLQRKNMVYVFNYRTLVPLRYKPGDGKRFFTKRMLIAIILLALNFAIVLLTCLLNLAEYFTISEAVRPVAVRLQLPSMVPLFFAAVFFVHAIVAAATPKNLIHTFLVDNHFCDNALSRFLFALRGLALVNVVNALQISLAGNNFLFDSAVFTVILYLVLTCLFVPFTTRVWFLPSVDEPKVGVLSWLTLLSVDTVLAFLILLPHLVIAVLEPFSCLVYYFFLPSIRPTEQSVSGSIRRRLLYHEQHRYAMPSRFSVVSGSRFIHVRFLSLLYWRSHSARETAHLDEAQLEAEGFRAFPLVDPESVGMSIETLRFGQMPDSSGQYGRAHSAFVAPYADTAATAAPRERMPLTEPLLTECSEEVLQELLYLDKGDGRRHSSATDALLSAGRRPMSNTHDGDEHTGHDGRPDLSCTKLTPPRTHGQQEHPPEPTDGSLSQQQQHEADESQAAEDDGAAAHVCALSRMSSRHSIHEAEAFQRSTADSDGLVDFVVKTLEGAGNGPADLPQRLKRAHASFAVRLPANELQQQQQQQQHPAERRRRRSLLPDPPTVGPGRAAPTECDAGPMRRPVTRRQRPLVLPNAADHNTAGVPSCCNANTDGLSAAPPTALTNSPSQPPAASKNDVASSGDVLPADAKPPPIPSSSSTRRRHRRFTLEGVPEVDSMSGSFSDSSESAAEEKTADKGPAGGAPGADGATTAAATLHAQQIEEPVSSQGRSHMASPGRQDQQQRDADGAGESAASLRDDDDGSNSVASEEAIAPPIVPGQYVPSPRRGGYRMRCPPPLQALELGLARSPQHQTRMQRECSAGKVRQTPVIPPAVLLSAAFVGGSPGRQQTAARATASKASPGGRTNNESAETARSFASPTLQRGLRAGTAAGQLDTTPTELVTHVTGVPCNTGRYRGLQSNSPDRSEAFLLESGYGFYADGIHSGSNGATGGTQLYGHGCAIQTTGTGRAPVTQQRTTHPPRQLAQPEPQSLQRTLATKDAQSLPPQTSASPQVRSVFGSLGSSSLSSLALPATPPLPVEQGQQAQLPAVRPPTDPPPRRSYSLSGYGDLGDSRGEDASTTLPPPPSSSAQQPQWGTDLADYDLDDVIDF